MRKPACRPGSRLRYRANIKISDEQDKLLNLSLAQREGSESLLKENNLLGSLTQSRNSLRVIDLFAGAGGMSTGFLMASNSKKSFRVIGAAEINPIYVKSLEKNHKFFEENATNRANDCCPKEFSPIDLKSQNGRDIIKNVVDREGGVDVLIGGPPCQGFSQSNRNSWSPDNPYNKLVDIFVKCAIELEPKVILLENVQGILWTPKSSERRAKDIGVVDYVSQKMIDAGYVLFPAVVEVAQYVGGE